MMCFTTACAKLLAASASLAASSAPVFRRSLDRPTAITKKAKGVPVMFVLHRVMRIHCWLAFVMIKFAAEVPHLPQTARPACLLPGLDATGCHKRRTVHRNPYQALRGVRSASGSFRHALGHRSAAKSASRACRNLEVPKQTEVIRHLGTRQAGAGVEGRPDSSVLLARACAHGHAQGFNMV